MADSAADVPGKYDCVINGYGYMFLRTLDGSYLSSGRTRAEYAYTPTFVTRQNVSNAYGDNAQDFFLTARMRDWSRGEQQKFFRSGSDGLYWMGQNIDISYPGRASLKPAITSIVGAQALTSGCRYYGTNDGVALVGATRLYVLNGAGAATDLGLHGLGVAPAPHGMCSDGGANYMSSTAAGTVGVRKYTGGAFSTFSATAADSLAFVNNTLYGLQGLNAGGVALVQYSTAGVATTLFSWKGGDGVATSAVPAPAKIEAFGGKLLILFAYGQDVGGELWIYDGTGCSRLEVFPSNFIAYDLEVLYGVAYVSGSFTRNSGATTILGKPAVLFFDGSQIGKIWEADSTVTFAGSIFAGPHPVLSVFQGDLVFTDDTNGNLMAYSPARGGVSTIATYTVAGNTTRLANSNTTFAHIRNQTTYYFYPASTYPSSGYMISSLVDFESSLTKQFRGIKVEFDAASDGNGGTVDIAYQVDSLTGSWTTLQSGAVSGTEYTLSNVSGHAVAVKITLNKGTSTAGPTLKSVNLRAAPVLQSFRLRTYNLDLTNKLDHQTTLGNGMVHPLSGFDQAQNLQTAITSTSPIQVTDKFGTFTAVCQPADCSILEVHSDGDSKQKPGQYVATVVVREV